MSRLLNYVRLLSFIEFLTLVAVLVLLVGCARLNPIAIAETPEQKYDAAVLTYNALLEPATQIVEDPAAPADLRRALQATIAQSGEVYRTARDAFDEFQRAKGLVEDAGAGNRIEAAAANLETWLLQLEGISARLAALTNR